MEEQTFKPWYKSKKFWGTLVTAISIWAADPAFPELTALSRQLIFIAGLGFVAGHFGIDIARIRSQTSAPTTVNAGTASVITDLPEAELIDRENAN